MASVKFAWGIDVGNRALKAVKLVRDGDGFRVDEFEVIEHETVLSHAGDNKESLIQTALASFAQRHNMKGGIVSAGVSGQSSFARFIKLPPVEPKKIPEIVRFEAIQQIPFPLDDVEWSYQLFESPESPDVEVGIFAMRKELVNQHIKYFTDIDMNVQYVQMNPLAVYNALQYDGKFDRGVTMVIDIGAENTDLLIADNDTIWMRSIPIGGNNFTETLVKAFKLNFAKAEDLKRNSATSKYARQIFQAMRPIFADLVAEIQRSIGFYASVHRDSRIKKAIAIGGTFRLPGLQKYLQQNLQLDVERLDAISAGPLTDPKLAGAFNENLLSLVGAYGLALQAMESAKISSSLLPASIRREKMWQEKTKWFAAAAALFVIGTGLAGTRYAFTKFQFDGGQNARSQIEDVKHKATDLDAQWSAVESAGQTELHQVIDMQKLAGYRTFWPSLIADVYGALPADQHNPAATQPGELAKTARASRKQILIEGIYSRYDPTLGAKIVDPDFAKFATGDVAAAAPATPATPAPDAPVFGNGVGTATSRGFLVLVRCTSPDVNAMSPNGLVFKDFLDRLLQVKPDEQRPRLEYGIARAAVGRRIFRVKDDSQRLQQLKTQYESMLRAQQAAAAAAATTAGGAPNGTNPNGRPTGQQSAGYNPNRGFPTPGGGESGMYNPNTAAADNEAFKDPGTGESVLNDWEFDVVLAVAVVDATTGSPAPAPPPPAVAPAGQQANAQ